MAKNNRVEVLLEEIRGDVKAIAEGHVILRREIVQTREELSARIDTVEGAVRLVSQDVKEIKHKLDEHIRLPASLAHAAV